MIYHSPGTVYAPSNYKDLLGYFVGKMSLDSYLFRGPDIGTLIKNALANGHLQESAVDAGARHVLYMTRAGQEYWQLIKDQN